MGTCKDCIHEGVCWKQEELLSEREWGEEQECCEDANLYVKLPCKVGDIVYIINDYDKFEIYKCRVNEFSFSMSKPVMVIDRLIGSYVLQRCRGMYLSDFGKTIFLSREEAENALKALKKG